MLDIIINTYCMSVNGHMAIKALAIKESIYI